jgi:PBP1b-binding outer membrane lipoprotein LpoB
MRYALMLLAALLLTGCASTSSIIKELAKDNASACVHLDAFVYGKATFCRTNTQGAAIIGVVDGNMQIQHSGAH